MAVVYSLTHIKPQKELIQHLLNWDLVTISIIQKRNKPNPRKLSTPGVVQFTWLSQWEDKCEFLIIVIASKINLLSISVQHEKEHIVLQICPDMPLNTHSHIRNKKNAQ